MQRKEAEKTRFAELEQQVGMFKANTCDCFSVYITPEGIKLAEESGDSELCQTLSALPGKYWHIGCSIDDYPVYRQEFVHEGLNNQQLFMFFKAAPNERGWYISQTLELQKNGEGTFAWMKVSVANSMSAYALAPCVLLMPSWWIQCSPWPQQHGEH